MVPNPILAPLTLTDADRRTLHGWIRRRTTAQALALRARIVLACADGDSNSAVATRLGINRGTVALWRSRFLRDGPDGNDAYEPYTFAKAAALEQQFPDCGGGWQIYWR